MTKKKAFAVLLTGTLMVASTATVLACTPNLSAPKMSDDYYKALDSAYKKGEEIGSNIKVTVSPEEDSSTKDNEEVVVEPSQENTKLETNRYDLKKIKELYRNKMTSFFNKNRR